MTLLVLVFKKKSHQNVQKHPIDSRVISTLDIHQNIVAEVRRAIWDEWHPFIIIRTHRYCPFRNDIKNIFCSSWDLNLSGKLQQGPPPLAAATSDTSCLFECFIWLPTNFFSPSLFLAPLIQPSLVLCWVWEEGKAREEEKQVKSQRGTNAELTVKSRKAITRFSRLRRRLFLVWQLTQFTPLSVLTSYARPPQRRSCRCVNRKDSVLFYDFFLSFFTFLCVSPPSRLNWLFPVSATNREERISQFIL